MDIIEKINLLEENYFLSSLEEADEDLAPSQPEQNQQPPAAAPTTAGGNEDINALGAEGGADPMAMGGGDGMDSMGGGMGMGSGGGFGMDQEEEKTSTEIGRIYEVRKIYHRMEVINNFLKNNPDIKLDPIKKLVGEAYDIFNIVVNNISSFKDKIDDVITQYYKFVEKTLIILEKYYKINKSTPYDGS